MRLQPTAGLTALVVLCIPPTAGAKQLAKGSDSGNNPKVVLKERFTHPKWLKINAQLDEKQKFELKFKADCKQGSPLKRTVKRNEDEFQSTINFPRIQTGCKVTTKLTAQRGDISLRLNLKEEDGKPG